MSIHDTIADALTIIRNGCTSKKESVYISFSKNMINVLEILEKEGYIKGFKEVEVEGKKFSRIKVDLKYYDNKSVIEGLKRISKPGLRIYASSDNLPQVKNGFGISIISTSKGVMTGRDALKENTGGEVLCYVW